MIKALILIIFSLNAYSMSFKEAVKVIGSHDLIESSMAISQSLNEESKESGSWGDPRLSIAAKNFPKDSLKDNETPMTGVEFGVSQKIPLTTKYGKMKMAKKALSISQMNHSLDEKQKLLFGFWELLIEKRRLISQKKILDENLIWIGKILKVSKKLYANGKASQQAILEIEIRKSEIETQLSNIFFEIEKVKSKMLYLTGEDSIDQTSIPWASLAENTKKKIDYREISLKEKLKAKELAVEAAKLNYIPDVTFSIGYTKRSNIDDRGDFLSASVSFPIPTSSIKSSNFEKNVFEKKSAIKNYENYKSLKTKEKSLLEAEQNRLKKELSILNKKTINFAKNSRAITSKSYGIGNSSYIELLQSELLLQKLLTRKIQIEKDIAMNTLNLKYLLGEKLDE